MAITRHGKRVAALTVHKKQGIKREGPCEYERKRGIGGVVE